MDKFRPAVFADLQYPHTISLTVESAKKELDALLGNDINAFAPRSIDYAFKENLRSAAPDSHYGERMRLTQNFIAAALYDDGSLVNHLQTICDCNASVAKRQHNYFNSAQYVWQRLTKPVSKKSREVVNARTCCLDDYYGGHSNGELVAMREVVVDVYDKLTAMVTNFERSFRVRDVQEIIALAELNHYFSGEKNGTGQDITFTDSRVRQFGVEIQQQIERIWRNGKELVDKRPLSLNELLPRIPHRAA